MFYPDLTSFGVDNERLKSQRLARLQQAMKDHDLSAMILTDWLNIRYATNSVLMMNLRASAIQRFILVPASGSPLISQRALARSKVDPQLRDFDAFMFGMRPPVATKDFAFQAAAGLRELGVTNERVGVDCLNLEAVDALKAAGIFPVDGSRAIQQARIVKTVDEIQLIRWTTRAKEKGYDLVRQALHESDLPEERLSRIMLDHLLDQGFEAGSEFVQIWDSSKSDLRTHNEPMGTELVVVEGDLVICDATVAGPGGYYSDFARTFSRGKPTTQSREQYREAYDTLQTGGSVDQTGAVYRVVAPFRQELLFQASRI